MKLLILVFFVGVASAGYHKTVGIPTAQRIRLAESSGYNARIVNGNYAQMGSYPYFAGLLIVLHTNLLSICGSTLISDTKLVTAAHCWSDGDDQAEMVQVVLGSTTLFSGGTRIITDQVTAHESFNPKTVQHDIAVVTIPAIEFDAYITPIKLPEDLSIRFVDYPAQVVGFGMKNETTMIEVSQRLSYAEVTVRRDQYCMMYGPIFTSTMICTEGISSGPCMGDSGGPLIYKENTSEDILIGVVSYGSDEGCSAGHPSVYTRLTSYIDWINSN